MAPKKSWYEKYEIRHKLPDPKTSVLLVIDMQQYFLPTAKPIIPTIVTTIQLCQHAGIPVIYTRHRHKAGDDGGILGEWWGGHLVWDDNPNSQLIPEVVSAFNLGDDQEVEVIEKETYNAFWNTHLQKRLEELGVKEVIITGVNTNMCCETTARDAFVRGFRVFFSTMPQRLHRLMSCTRRHLRIWLMRLPILLIAKGLKPPFSFFLSY